VKKTGRGWFFAVTAAAVLMTGCGEKNFQDNLKGVESWKEAESELAELAAQTETGEMQAETAAYPTETEEGEEAGEDFELELFNTYVDINNIMVGDLDNVLSGYFDYVGYQEEFVLEEEDYWCLSVISTFYEYMEQARELAEQKTEKSELDQAYLNLYPVMKELAETLDEVEQYTDMLSYVDDDYEKGRELHAVIWKDLQEYEILGNEFINQLAVTAEARREDSLQRMIEGGYEATYAFNMLILTAQDIQDAIYEQGVSDENLMELDLEALQPLYDRYVEAVETALECMEDEDAMYEEGYPVNSAYYSLFDDAIKESKVALTELFRRVKEQTPLEDYEIEFELEGSLSYFYGTISEIIDDYNEMISYYD